MAEKEVGEKKERKKERRRGKDIFYSCHVYLGAAPARETLGGWGGGVRVRFRRDR